MRLRFEAVSGYRLAIIFDGFPNNSWSKESAQKLTTHLFELMYTLMDEVLPHFKGYILGARVTRYYLPGCWMVPLMEPSGVYLPQQLSDFLLAYCIL